MEIILLLIGLIFFSIGIFLIWDQLRIVLSSERIEGTVVGYEKKMVTRSGKNPRVMFYPIVEYIALGERKKLYSNLGSGFPSYDIGDTVQIYYSKESREARMKMAAPFIGGVLFLLVGGYLLYIYIAIITFSIFSGIFTAAILILLFWILLKIFKKSQAKNLPEWIERFKKRWSGEPGIRNLDDGDLITTQEELLSSNLYINRNLQYSGPAFLVIGIGLIILAGYYWMNTLEFMEVAITAEGEVVDYEVRGSGDNETLYPIIVFSTEDNREYEFTHEAGSGTDSYYQINSSVRVLYDPDQPYDAMIDQGAWNWLWPVLLSFIAMAFIGSGFVMTRRWLKIKRFQKKVIAA